MCSNFICDCAAVRFLDPQVGTGLFQYFIRVIPTIYTDEYGTKHYTNQYTTAERFRPFALPAAPGEVPTPQVCFITDTMPMY
jgi:hypothetical protein